MHLDAPPTVLHDWFTHITQHDLHREHAFEQPWWRMQAHGLWPKVCICTWHICCENSPHQHVRKADRTDVASVRSAPGEMEGQSVHFLT